MQAAIASAAFFLAAVSQAAGATDYPTRPIRIVVSLAAGSVADSVARLVAQPLSTALGQPVIVDNKPGADGAIASEAVRKSRPDGYTLLWGQSTALIGVPLMHKKAPYDPVADFTPLSLVGRLTICLFAHPDVPARTLLELVEHARANPGQVSYATNGLSEAVIAAQMAKAAGITMVRVPYKGGQQASLDLIAGRVQLGFGALATSLPQVHQGRLRILATLLPRRSPAAPDTPTIAEAGFPQVTVYPWFGLFAPARLPTDLTERLSREINVALAQVELRAKLDRYLVQVDASTPQALSTFVREELATWRTVIHEAGITPD